METSSHSNIRQPVILIVNIYIFANFAEYPVPFSCHSLNKSTDLIAIFSLEKVPSRNRDYRRKEKLNGITIAPIIILQMICITSKLYYCSTSWNFLALFTTNLLSVYRLTELQSFVQAETGFKATHLCECVRVFRRRD